jgi:hypothetical protein
MLGLFSRRSTTAVLGQQLLYLRGVNKHGQFAALAPSFLGRRGLLVEYGPTIVGCKVVDVSCDAERMQARIVCDDGKETLFGGRWDNRRFDAGEQFDIDDYL